MTFTREQVIKDLKNLQCNMVTAALCRFDSHTVKEFVRDISMEINGMIEQYEEANPMEDRL